MKQFYSVLQYLLLQYNTIQYGLRKYQYIVHWNVSSLNVVSIQYYMATMTGHLCSLDYALQFLTTCMATKTYTYTFPYSVMSFSKIQSCIATI